MSTRSWQDWSCTIRLVVGRDTDVASPILHQAEGTVRTLMADVERAVSRFRPDSELEVLNDAAPRVLPVGPLALSLVEVALEAARHTGGATDPTVGAHLRALGYDADLGAVRHRPRAATHEVPVAGGWSRVVLDRDLGLVGVPRGVRLDLGATAKAWTADEAARRVAARHRLPVLVEIGGDVAVAGPADASWRVRVAETAGGPGEIVGLTHGGLATSSTLARRWETEQGSAHHLLDPATGGPVAGRLRTATVWAGSAAAANALSTAALVWGDADRVAASGASARLVDVDGQVTTVGGWPGTERAA